MRACVVLRITPRYLRTLPVSDNGEGLVKIDEGCLYQADDAGEAIVPISLREGLKHPVTLNQHDLLMDVELIDDGAFCALRDMKTDSKEYAVMRANVTREEREFLSEYNKQSEPQGGGALVRRFGNQ